MNMDQFWYDNKVKPKETPKKIQVFDTTLRDGEQTPGVTLSLDDKVEIAQALNDLGVDIIEAGFPVSSDGELEAVKAISELGLKSKVCGLARCVEKDMDACIDAGVDLVHIFIGTSPIHRKYKLKMSKQDILKSTRQCIQYVRDAGFKVHFSPEDACRTELDYLKQVCKVAQEAKADHINIPDTVGVMTPAAMHWLIGELKKSIKIPLAVHCHNDFGMAVANTLAGITAGATIPHVTVNGLGERAGNADMEQTVLGCKLIYGIRLGIRTKNLYRVSKVVERLTGINVMPNFPIVGENAFAHEAGVHVHGVLAKAATYECITPEMVGAKRRLVLGKLIGSHGIRERLGTIGIKVNAQQLKEITKKVKDLGDKGKRVTEEDLEAIAEDILGKVSKEKRKVELKDLVLHSELGEKPVASVVLTVKGRQKRAKGEGVGPVDATISAIKAAIGDSDIQMDEYHLDAITGGSDALADVTIRVSKNGNSTLAHGVHEDVVMASVIAFINGLNRILK